MTSPPIDERIFQQFGDLFEQVVPRPSEHRGDLLVRFVLEGERDPLAVLGLSSAATADDIKQAYRRWALKLHPDRHPGDAKAARRFQELGEAYTALIGESTSPSAETRAATFWWWLLVLVLVAGAVFGFLYLALRCT